MSADRADALHGDLGAALTRLLAELSDVQIEAVREGCGNSNAAVLKLRIREVREALAARPVERPSESDGVRRYIAAGGECPTSEGWPVERPPQASGALCPHGKRWDWNCEICTPQRRYLPNPAASGVEALATSIVEKWLPCWCDAAYTDRKLVAPDCPRHQFGDDLADDIAAALTERGARQL